MIRYTSHAPRGAGAAAPGGANGQAAPPQRSGRGDHPGDTAVARDNAQGPVDAGRPYLNTAQAAYYLGIGWRKLMRLRVAGEGPRFRRHGRLIVYHPADLDAWSLSTSPTHV